MLISGLLCHGTTVARLTQSGDVMNLYTMGVIVVVIIDRTLRIELNRSLAGEYLGWIGKSISENC